MRALRSALAFLVLATLVVGLAPQSAHADVPNCQDSWPTTGKVQTSNWPETDDYVVTFRFTLTQGQLDALQCAQFLELDFRIRGFSVPAEWEGYTVEGSNLPGAIHDVAYGDSANEPNPAVTRINTWWMKAGVEYYATIRWTAPKQSGATPYIFFVWTPSHWSSWASVTETGACVYGLNNPLLIGDPGNHNEAWCIFPYADRVVTLLGDKAFAGGFPNGYLPLDGFRWYEFGPTTAVQGASTTLPSPQTLTLTQGLNVWPSSNSRVYQPLKFSYTVQNTSGYPASLARIEVAVRAPDGSAQDVMCANGVGVALQPNDTFTCDARLPQGYGSQGTYTMWADWMGYDGSWHHGQLGSDQSFTLAAPYTLSVAQLVSVGPSGNVSKLTPLNFSYRVRNTSGGWASIQRFSVPVRGPGGVPLDVPCANGTGVTLAPNEEWTCDAKLSTGYGSQGTYTFWADWLAYDGSWHQGNLSGNLTFTLGPPNTLSTTQYLAISPSGTVATNSGVTFTYQVRNTSGAAASIQRFAVAVRDPNGNALDAICAGGNGVALAANATFTCTASVPSGYATQGLYTYWADWMDYNGVWHDGQLSDRHMFVVS